MTSNHDESRAVNKLSSMRRASSNDSTNHSKLPVRMQRTSLCKYTHPHVHTGTYLFIHPPVQQKTTNTCRLKHVGGNTHVRSIQLHKPHQGSRRPPHRLISRRMTHPAMHETGQGWSARQYCPGDPLQTPRLPAKGQSFQQHLHTIIPPGNESSNTPGYKDRGTSREGEQTRTPRRDEISLSNDCLSCW